MTYLAVFVFNLKPTWSKNADSQAAVWYDQGTVQLLLDPLIFQTLWTCAKIAFWKHLYNSVPTVFNAQRQLYYNPLPDLPYVADLGIEQQRQGTTKDVDLDIFSTGWPWVWGHSWLLWSIYAECMDKKCQMIGVKQTDRRTPRWMIFLPTIPRFVPVCPWLPWTNAPNVTLNPPWLLSPVLHYPGQQFHIAGISVVGFWKIYILPKLYYVCVYIYYNIYPAKTTLRLFGCFWVHFMILFVLENGQNDFCPDWATERCWWFVRIWRWSWGFATPTRN